MTQLQQLNLEADRIELVLARHQVPGRVSGGVVTPKLVRFRFVPELGTRINRLKALTEEIALSLGARDCRIHREEGSIHIDVDRGGKGMVSLMDVSRRLARVPACTPVLGVDDEGFPVLLSLSAPEITHVLVSGATGSGKTALARTMVASLAMHNPQGRLQLALIDLKGRGLSIFAGLPHLLCPVAETSGEAMATLRLLVREMEQRDAERVSAPRIVVFIDELAELLMAGGDEARELLTRLTQRGREAGVHLVACTQKPLAGLIGSLAKGNFPARIVGKVASADDARVASGLAGSGAERLAGHGEFIVIAAGEQVRIQGAYIDEAQIASVVERARGGDRRRLRG